jgi:hypothetical protein
MKRFLAIVIFGLVVGFTFAQESVEVLATFEMDGFEGVTVSFDNFVTALYSAEQYGVKDIQNGCKIRREDLKAYGDKALMGNFDQIFDEFQEELEGRVGGFFYYYPEANVRVGAILWNDTFFISSDSEEINSGLQEVLNYILKDIVKT